MDYDTWFDYLRLLENEGELSIIREAYEKAIAQIPPIQVEKKFRTKRFFIFFLLVGKTILASLHLFVD